MSGRARRFWSWRAYALVFFGGALGSAARQWWVEAWPGASPFGSVAAANVFGSLFIGFVMSLALEAERLDDRWRLFLTTGLLGGFTTFSTYEVVVWEFGRRSPAFAVLYAFAGLLSALLAVILGQGLARWIWLRRSWGDEPAAEIDRGLGEPAPEDGRILTRRP